MEITGMRWFESFLKENTRAHFFCVVLFFLLLFYFVFFNTTTYVTVLHDSNLLMWQIKQGDKSIPATYLNSCLQRVDKKSRDGKDGDEATLDRFSHKLCFHGVGGDSVWRMFDIHCFDEKHLYSWIQQRAQSSVLEVFKCYCLIFKKAQSTVLNEKQMMSEEIR